MKNLRNCVKIATGTDVGCVRTNNEDSVGKNEQIGLAVLADGMGGHNAGEVAGAMAVGSILHELSTTLRQQAPGQPGNDGEYGRDAELLRQAIENANVAIHRTAAGNLAYHGMGTTIVAAAFHNDRISAAHVGDSRLYRLRGGELKQLTTDHSLAHELIANGYFKSYEEVVAAGMKNAITRALGLDAEVNVDLLEDTVQAGDLYLLCSDGLTDMVADTEILSTLQAYRANLERCVAQLIALAKQNGGKDNISVILARPMKPRTDNANTPWHRKLGQWFGNLFSRGGN
ncbi:Stp1/IreP family PP2C-type Ser/Thr phosphatase [Methylogaea oryzae]|uniref:Protein phosphatase PrpC n=1 Tax=Methylogaea oryzae TaxID=1295382 RepID=A0A8D4VTL9_9GAMM|nr:Stp1/IreP family PP2C-type Ser/Thr phosphatase [Methylogaea oryzae]BBL72085.1 protein phosphatase PrpC [Methylogaea oryzae]